MNEGKCFYLVWREGGYPPTVKHETWRSAQEEAQRLARKHPGVAFHVLRQVETWRADLPLRKYLPGDEIPPDNEMDE